MKGLLYQIQGLEKPNLLWDTKTLFSLLPKVQPRKEVRLLGGAEAFVFQSAPYGEKSETWVFAAIGVPTSPKPAQGYPAVVLVHGGEGQVFDEWILHWTKQGYVAIAIDLFSNQLNERLEKVENPDGGHPENEGSNYDGVENPKQSWVYHSVYNVIMAHNLLRNRADVDKDRIVITGISWGGYVTSVTSGVDTRFAAFAPTYGCGFVYEDGFWINGHGDFGGAENRAEWIALYDPSSYLPYATKPMLFTSGIDDAFFSAVNRAKSAALIKGRAFYSQRSDLPHGHCWQMMGEIPAFFRHVLYGEDCFMTICHSNEKDGVATLETDGKKLSCVRLIYTLSKDEDSHKWEWKTLPIALKEGKYSCQLPLETTAYLFETEGEIADGAPLFRQSTPIYFK